MQSLKDHEQLPKILRVDTNAIVFDGKHPVLGLLPRKDGNGRVAALEIMIVTPTIRDLMLDRDKVGEIRDYIAAGREQYGMQTFDQHLEQLVQDGSIDLKVALAASTRPSDLALKFSMGS